MKEDITIRQAVENYFGDEFPEIREFSDTEFQEKIGINPDTRVKWADLEDTFKIANYFNENHINTVEAMAIEAGLI